MGLNVKSIATLVENCTVKGKVLGKTQSVLQMRRTVPELLQGINHAELKVAILEKDIASFQKTEKPYFERSELENINKKLNKFYEEKIIPAVNPELPPKVRIIPKMDKIKGQGFYHFISNEILLIDDVLFNPDFNKLIDKETGNCLSKPDSKWQMTGTKRILNHYIKKFGLKNTEIVPLTRAERFNVLECNCLHEADHSRQAANQIMHEKIGPERKLDEFMKDARINVEGALNIRAHFNEVWKPVIENGKKIKSHTTLGKKTMNQFVDQLAVCREKDPYKFIERYSISSHERETYRREWYWDRKLGINLP